MRTLSSKVDASTNARTGMLFFSAQLVISVLKIMLAGELKRKTKELNKQCTYHPRFLYYFNGAINWLALGKKNYFWRQGKH